MILYVAVAFAAVLSGAVFVEYTLTSSVSGWSILIEAAVAVLVAYGIYGFVRRSRPSAGDDPTLVGVPAEPLPASDEAQ